MYKNKLSYLFAFLYILSLYSVNIPSLANIVVMRHGEAEHNVEGTYNSDQSSPEHKISNLTDTGKKQVLETIQKLLNSGINKTNVDILIVSPFPRTLQTANLLKDYGIIDKSRIKIELRLSEIKILNRENETVASYEGKPWDGETFQDVAIRAIAAYKDIRKYKNNVIIVTHGIPANLILDHILKTKTARIRPGEAHILQKEKN